MARELDKRRIGLMCQPKSNPPKAGWLWAADNGCFSDRWDEQKWAAWLAKDMPRSGCLFATVPDIVGDAEATLERFYKFRDAVCELRYPIAYVAQDGAIDATTPWGDMDCLFIGGSTEWKLGPNAFALAAAARTRNKWVHVGRINSRRRYRMWAPYADSCDGTFLAFGPQKNLPRLLEWLTDDVAPVDVPVERKEAYEQPSLFE